MTKTYSELKEELMQLLPDANQDRTANNQRSSDSKQTNTSFLLPVNVQSSQGCIGFIAFQINGVRQW